VAEPGLQPTDKKNHGHRFFLMGLSVFGMGYRLQDWEIDAGVV